MDFDSFERDLLECGIPERELLEYDDTNTDTITHIIEGSIGSYIGSYTANNTKKDCLYTFNIYGNIKHIKSITLQIDIGGLELSPQDKIDFLSSEISFNINYVHTITYTNILILLTQNVLSNRCIVQDENILTIPLFYYEDGLPCPLYGLSLILYLNSKVNKLNIIVEETKTISKTTQNTYLDSIVVKKDVGLNMGLPLDLSNTGNYNRECFGILFYDKNLDYDTPQVDILTLYDYLKQETIDYTQENIFQVDIWGLNFYMISFLDSIYDCIDLFDYAKSNLTPIKSKFYRIESIRCLGNINLDDFVFRGLHRVIVKNY